LLLTVCMVFSLAACNKKQITAEKFLSALEDNGLVGEIVPEELVDGEKYSFIDGAYGQGPEENPIYIANFYRYPDKESAEEDYERMFEEFKLKCETEGYKGTEVESGKGNLNRVVLNANPVDETRDTGIYCVFLQVDEIVIALVSFDNSSDAIDKIDSILKDCGYYYP